ncbi:MAG TPA: protoporphyrinogen oxidase [Candidatus Limnocylindrales bacterium]|nr:protoporphyrinogen oxidase [Candidatus Limnocylindrales bacterium]
MTTDRVIVVGGGITGLAAARRLALAGIPVTLVEAGERLGGRIATRRADGFTLEDGPDSFLTTRPAALDLVRELGLGDRLVAPLEPRRVFIRHRGRLLPVPDGVGLGIPSRLTPMARTRLFSPAEKLRMAADLVSPRVLEADDAAVGSFLRARLGSALVDRLAGPLLGGVYGTPIDELSLDAVMPQLRRAERDHRSLLLAGLADRRAAAAAPRTGTPGTTPFVALREGMGTIVDALEEALVAAGVDIVRGRPLAGLARAGGGVRARFADGDRWTVAGAVLTVPGPAAARLLGDELPVAARALAAIPHGASTLVTLAYPRSAVRGPLAGHGYLVPAAERSPVSACTWVSEKWPGRAPADAVLFRLSVRSAGHGFDPATAPDGEVVVAARGDVERTLGISGRPLVSHVTRWPDAMARYTVGHLQRLEAVEAALADWPAVVLAGASYRGMGLPDCVAQGTDAAHRLVERLGSGPAAGETRPLAATA